MTLDLLVWPAVLPVTCVLAMLVVHFVCGGNLTNDACGFAGPLQKTANCIGVKCKKASGVPPTASRAKRKQQASGSTAGADNGAADAAVVAGFDATLFGNPGGLS